MPDTSENNALKIWDEIAISALREALAAIDNAEAPNVNLASRHEKSEYVAGALAGADAGELERRRLDDAEMKAIVQAQIEERSRAATEYERLGRKKTVKRLRREAEVLSDCLAQAR